MKVAACLVVLSLCAQCVAQDPLNRMADALEERNRAASRQASDAATERFMQQQQAAYQSQVMAMNIAQIQREALRIQQENLRLKQKVEGLEQEREWLLDAMKDGDAKWIQDWITGCVKANKFTWDFTVTSAKKQRPKRP